MRFPGVEFSIKDGRTYFDLRKTPHTVPIPQIFSHNGVLLDFDRIKTPIVRERDAALLITRDFESEVNAELNMEIAKRIADHKPTQSGGKHVRLVLDDVFPADFLDDSNRKWLAEFPIIDGKLFKSHTHWYYASGVSQILNIINFCVKYKGLKKSIIFSSFPSSLFGYSDKYFPERKIIEYLEKNLGVSVFSFYSARGKEDEKFTLFRSEADLLELLELWKIKYSRPTDQILNATLRVSEIKGRRLHFESDSRFDMVSFLSALEELTPELIDQFSGPSDDENQLPNELVGGDKYKIGPRGLEIRQSNAEARIDKKDLQAKYKAAVVAFSDFESTVRGLENTAYSSFAIFAGPIKEALGAELSDCDPIFLLALHKPFKRIFDAAKRDEKNDQDGIQEFQPIDNVRREHLQWLSSSIFELAHAMRQQSEIESEALHTGVSAESVRLVESEILDLIHALSDVSDKISEKLFVYSSMLRKAPEQSSEIAHSLMASIANLTNATLSVMQQADKLVEVPDNKTEVPHKMQPAWNSFQSQMGKRSADALVATVGIAGAVTVATIWGWFTSASANLKLVFPMLFELLKYVSS